MRFAFLAILVLATRCTFAQPPADAQLGEHVDRLANATLAAPVAGISVAVARGGQRVLARGYGLADLEHSLPVTPETAFHIDSISKNIEAAALLQLVDEGKLSLDDDVTKYVPEAPTNTRHITVRQLLNHTSGIYSFTSLPNAEENERLNLNLNLNHDQVLALFRDRPPDFAPGTSWRYNNSGFDARCEAAHPITKLAHALSSARN